MSVLGSMGGKEVTCEMRTVEKESRGTGDKFLKRIAILSGTIVQESPSSEGSAMPDHRPSTLHHTSCTLTFSLQRSFLGCDLS